MFGERLKYLRINDGLTQEELGKKLGVTKMVVSNWELNKGTPNYDMLKKIADIFGVSIDYLLDYDKDFDINNSIDFKNRTIKKVIEMLKDKNISEKELEKAIKIVNIMKEDKKK